MASRSSQDAPSTSGLHAPGELTVKRPIAIVLALALFLGFAPVAVAVLLIYRTSAHGADRIAQTSEEALRRRAFDQLVAVSEIKKAQIENFFAGRINDARVLADSPFLRQAFQELDAALDAGGGSAGGDFKGQTNGKYDAPAEYVSAHDKYFPTFKYYMDQYGYDDLFLMCVDHGDVSFTVTKRAEFGQRTSESVPSLRDVWRIAAKEGRAAISDTRPYEPSAGAPAQFVVAPIKEGDEVIGVVALQISLDAINKIMGERSGLGDTGGTYLVGEDHYLRCDSKLDHTPMTVVSSFGEQIRVDSESVAKALGGKTGQGNVSIHVNGQPQRILSAYTAIDVLGMRWALLAEIDEAEAFAAVGHVRQIHKSTAASLAAWAAGLSGVCLLAIVLVGLGIHWKITRPIRRVALAARAAADGNLDVQTAAEGKSEIAVLGQAFNQMISNLKRVLEQISSAGSKMVSASREQAEGAKNQSVATEEMTGTVTELSASARKMAENAGSVSEQAGLASNECASGKTSVEGAVQGIKGVHERVEKIAAHMLELGGKSQQISGVLDIITELSEQTNLLSLNASIEAAGAGDAGKRFAVVASEIRKLAERATDSTGEIRSLIDGVQETVNATIMATEEGTKAVQDGVRLTQEVDSSFGRIAEQVGSTTQSAKAIEMGSRQQATAIEQMEGAVKNVDAAAQQTAETARQLDADSQALLETARKLQQNDRDRYAV